MEYSYCRRICFFFSYERSEKSTFLSLSLAIGRKKNFPLSLLCNDYAYIISYENGISLTFV